MADFLHEKQMFALAGWRTDARHATRLWRSDAGGNQILQANHANRPIALQDDELGNLALLHLSQAVDGHGGGVGSAMYLRRSGALAAAPTAQNAFGSR